MNHIYEIGQNKTERLIVQYCSTWENAKILKEVHLLSPD